VIPLTGFLIALAIGLTGIGGGTITAPVLLLFLGLSPAEAVGTALVFVAGVKLLAAPQYLWRGMVNYRVLRLLLAGGIPGVVAGSLLLDRIDSIHWQGAILAFVGGTVLVTAGMDLYRRLRRKTIEPGTLHPKRLISVSLPIGMEVGFSSAGAGALGTLALMQWTPLGAAEIVGTDIAFGLGLALVGGGLHLSFGAVDPRVLAALLLGGIPGALIGPWLATRVPGHKLRLGLAAWLAYLGSQLLLRGIHNLW
jgi:uncharacterized protein